MIEGMVYIVGAGPGDPKLMTLRAWEVLQVADTVVYDRLVSAPILQMIRKGAVRICVGKKPHSKKFSQEDINTLLISEAKSGKKVVRLKGGDPFLFGRGGEEAEVLRAEGIQFEVVPGVASALGVPAYAGIPVTHRKYSSSVAIVTGHEDPSKKETRVKWSRLASSVETIVILMGVATLDKVARELIRGGLDPDTLVAAIECGTTERQRTTLFTLREAVECKAGSLLNSPSVIVVGKVAGLAKELGWFQRGRLQVGGGRIVRYESDSGLSVSLPQTVHGNAKRVKI